MSRIAKLAPRAKDLPSSEDLIAQLRATLDCEFSLPELPIFSVLFEGWTDVSYIERAVELHMQASGKDLLAIPPEISGVDGARIGIFTPGRPGDPARGGVSQMVRLARELQLYVFRLGVFKGLVFVFDHDEAGLEAATKLADLGYARDSNILTLDPKDHPDACARKQVVVEDLLSLRIQKVYFESASATCSVDYVDGNLERYRWGHSSKPLLRDYVLEQADVNDLQEVVRLVRRIRRACELPD
ncbi:hypothetical protein Pla123a_44510 [Posidoniimonas polymericola]|uniref:Uncharacterized protein n=1 Tax=Posidoniimonas polymericola TaxID=2528002 RepID=A0A5C5XWX7_9BACT|nr:hypothetical protein [Posidoniimonas polymericola]TWT67021.1 hypothetical protein Pla123a_44510 [Posidoniimonas polymericola]